jgi:hypothetical protein
MWHKARAQPSQGVAGQPHHFGQPATSWRIYKKCFVYVSIKGGAQGIQCPKVVQGVNLATRPNKWASHAQSSARAPP